MLRVRFSDDGKSLASAGGDKTVRVWDVDTGETTLVLRDHAHWVADVCFAPDGRRLASACAIADGRRVVATGIEARLHTRYTFDTLRALLPGGEAATKG